MIEQTEYNLLENIPHNQFKISILCKECNRPCGLVKGGLTGRPRLFCFNEEEIKDTDEVEIEVSE